MRMSHAPQFGRNSTKPIFMGVLQPKDKPQVEVKNVDQKPIAEKPRFTAIIGEMHDGHQVYLAPNGKKCWLNAGKNPVFLPTPEAERAYAEWQKGEEQKRQDEIQAKRDQEQRAYEARMTASREAYEREQEAKATAKAEREARALTLYTEEQERIRLANASKPGAFQRPTEIIHTIGQKTNIGAGCPKGPSGGGGGKNSKKKKK